MIARIDAGDFYILCPDNDVPRQLDEHGLKRKAVKFPDATLKRLIQDYTHEAGVRQLNPEGSSGPELC